MTPFKFKVGDKVCSTGDGFPFCGFVIGRLRYQKGVEKFHYTPGERLYVVDDDLNDLNSVQTFVEGFLKKAKR